MFFDKQRKRDKVKKMADGGYNRKDLMSLWANKAKIIMRYITLDSHFESIFSYHLTILNHFRHDKNISFSFYLLSTLGHGLSNHSKSSDKPMLHEGLILLIMKC